MVLNLTDEEAAAVAGMLHRFARFCKSERPRVLNDAGALRLWAVAKKLYVASGCRPEFEPPSFVSGGGEAA